MVMGDMELTCEIAVIGRGPAGYAAAFRHNDHHWLGQLRMPSWLVYRHGDPLRAHAPRLRDLPSHVVVVDEPDGIEGMHARLDGWLAQTTPRPGGDAV